LMVLAKDGKRPEVVDEVMNSLEAVEGKAGDELLALTYIFASMVFESEAEHYWLQRRFGMHRDALRDSWAYQEILQEGVEKGLEKGREEGLEKERQQRLKDQRQMLMTIVETHFPNITQLAKKQAHAMKDPEALQNLVLKVFAAQSEEQATQILFDVTLKKKNNT